MLPAGIWDLDEAANGEEALQMAETGQYDLVVLDYTMDSSSGRLNGAQVAKQLIERRPATRCVGCTGGSTGWSGGAE